MCTKDACSSNHVHTFAWSLNPLAAMHGPLRLQEPDVIPVNPVAVNVRETLVERNSHFRFNNYLGESDGESKAAPNSQKSVTWKMMELLAAARAREAPNALELVRRERMLETGTQSRPLNASNKPSTCQQTHPPLTTQRHAL
jgi:hypothetical protein